MKGKHSQVNYSIYAKQKRELENVEVTIEHLDKISDFITATPHTFVCSFSFFEEKNHACIKYSLKSTLQLICQDSLEIFDLDFDISNTIIITEDDRLVEDSLYEPFICKSVIIDLKDIIKEEVLLNLPLIPKKDTSTCKNTKKHSYYSEQENVIQEKKNPFEILKTLK
ncbi:MULTISPECIES: YceD family protein [Francisella]|uniref:Large ribosomal RNA subunit accumulation protein YceD n=1 Tax=Francisella opportunistica TaxID=2016517 RepID=A0A345JQA0_9GAMM|nr:MULTISPECIES: DUF177 domain-containing protein [Francisella]APC91194.1 hypothetical protein BBG19_0458 [Francisella sp. MA067296]AXH29496.1 DUF177 domain-containing protein [Francisella opportunistica]AXH31147.1 hypothetical protein CGC44_02295 [Francisella opportunistica]AXH32792.1 hypothetical protein CGC45_02295 [Francisella opportunistica]